MTTCGRYQPSLKPFLGSPCLSRLFCALNCGSHDLMSVAKLAQPWNRGIVNPTSRFPRPGTRWSYPTPALRKTATTGATHRNPTPPGRPCLTTARTCGWTTTATVRSVKLEMSPLKVGTLPLFINFRWPAPPLGATQVTQIGGILKTSLFCSLLTAKLECESFPDLGIFQYNKKGCFCVTPGNEAGWVGLT